MLLEVSVFEINGTESGSLDVTGKAITIRPAADQGLVTIRALAGTETVLAFASGPSSPSGPVIFSRVRFQGNSYFENDFVNCRTKTSLHFHNRAQVIFSECLFDGVSDPNDLPTAPYMIYASESGTRVIFDKSTVSSPDLSYTSSIIRVVDNAELHLQNSTVSSLSTRFATLSAGQLFINNSTLEENHVEDAKTLLDSLQSGGVVLVNDYLSFCKSPLHESTIIIDQSTIRNNIASNGAVISNEALLHLNVTNSLVEGNRDNLVGSIHPSFDTHGGFLHSHGILRLLASNSTFRRNFAGKGGVFHIFGVATTLIRNCDFLGNTAHSYGGVISAAIDIPRSRWSEMLLTESPGYNEGQQINCDISSCRFHNNTVQSTCVLIGEDLNGPLWPSPSEAPNESDDPAIILRSKVQTMIGHGGAIAVLNQDISFTVVTVVDSDFQENGAGCGGSISSANSDVYVTHSSFEFNAAAVFGGAISMVGKASLIARESYFAYNKAYQAAALSLGRDVHSEVDSSSFIQNIASIGGSVYLLDFGFALHSTVLSQARKEITFRNSTFAHNVATFSAGGAIHADMTTANTLRFLNCDFIQNEALREGGAIYGGVFDVTTYTDYSNRLLQEVRFGSDNIDFLSRTLVVENCTFERNTGTNGGAMYLSTLLTVSDSGSVYTNNTATSSGGALFLSDLTSINFTDIRLDNCSADFRGGAIYADGVPMRIEGLSMSRSSSQFGGGMFCKEVSIVTSDAHFYDNTAQSSSTSEGTIGAGAIELLDSELSLVNCSFHGNTALEGFGGALGGSNVALSMSDVEFHGNSAKEQHGGAIYLTGGRLLVASGLMFSNNTARLHGGAVCLISLTSQVDIHRSEFLNNSAMEGGAIYLQSTTVNSSHSLMQANVASSLGGTVALMGSSSMTALLSRFSGHSQVADPAENVVPVGSGGAIFVDTSAALHLEDSSFVNISASASLGGALYFKDAVHSSIHNCSFYGITAAAGAALFLDSASGIEIYNVSSTSDSSNTNGEENNCDLNRLSFVSACSCGSNVGILYGNTMASATRNLRWDPPADRQLKSQLFSSDFVGHEPDLSLAVLDAFGQTVKSFSNILLRMDVSPVGEAIIVSDAPFAIVSEGVALFRRVSLLAPSGLFSLTVKVESGATELIVPPPHVVEVRPCPVGYFTIDSTVVSVCNKCPDGTYSLGGQSRDCVKCGKGSVCSNGVLQATSGYFAIFNSTGAGKALVVPCRPQHCEGDNRCRSLHEGAMCSDCVAGAKMWNGVCTECQGTKWGVVISIWLCLFIFVIYTVMFMRPQSATHRILVFFFQTLALLLRNDLQGSDGAFSQMSGFVFAIVQLRLDYFQSCVVDIDYYEQYTVALCLPLLLFTMYGLLYFMERFITRGRLEPYLPKAMQGRLNGMGKRYRYRNAAFSLWFFCYTPILDTIMRILKCQETFPGSGEHVLVHDTTIQCFTARYNRFYILTITLMAVMFYPLPLYVFGWIKWIRRTPEKEAESNKRYAILFAPYKERVYFWESVMQLRKLALVTLFLLVDGDSLLTAAYFVVFILVVHVTVFPFEVPRDNIVEVFCLIMLGSFGLLFSSRYYRDETTRSDAQFFSLAVMLPVALLMVYAGLQILGHFRTVRANLTERAIQNPEGNFTLAKYKEHIHGIPMHLRQRTPPEPGASPHPFRKAPVDDVKEDDLAAISHVPQWPSERPPNGTTLDDETDEKHT